MEKPPKSSESLEEKDKSPGSDVQLLTRRITQLFVWAVALVLLIHFFQAIKMVLLGFLAAAALAAALRPLVRKSPGPRSVKAVVIGIAPPILVIALFALTAWLLAEPIQRQFGNWPRMEQQINGALAGWSQRLGLSQPIQINDVALQLGDWITGSSGAKLFSTTTGFISGALIAMAFIFIGSIYLLLEPPGRLSEPLLKFFSPGRRKQLQRVFTDLTPRLRWWLIGTIIGSLVIGLASWLGYWLVGLEFALPLALLAGVGEAVPTIGPLVTFLVALIFASTQGIGKIIGVTIVYLVIQGLESYILMPVIMKKAVSIPPVVTLFTLVLWGTVFGLAGLLLAIPIDLVLWSFAKHFLKNSDDT